MGYPPIPQKIFIFPNDPFSPSPIAFQSFSLYFFGFFDTYITLLLYIVLFYIIHLYIIVSLSFILI